MDAFGQFFEILVVSLTSLSFFSLAAFAVSDIIAERKVTRARTAASTKPQRLPIHGLTARA